MVRVVLLMVGMVFFLSLMAAAVILAAMWGLRALWAKVTGQPVAPWIMPMRAAGTWASMAQRAGGFGGMAAGGAAPAAATQEESAPFTPAPGSKRGGILSKVAGDVSDVQAREVH